jgi:uncharacterized protein YhaN
MKLGEIRAENYGVFTNQRFQFGEQGFVLVHGPNEAGKSTLLQLVRELLFGFPHNCSYNFNSAGPLAASAEARMKDGRQLSFRRRKGRTKLVEGTLEPGHEEVDEAKLQALLSHATPNLYEHIFAFSLTELSAGNESIKNAGLTDSLVGGGLGGVEKWQRIRKSLGEDHEELFNPAARARNPQINQLLSRIREVKKQRRAAIVKPSEYREQETRYAKLRGEIAQLQERRQQQLAQLAHFERLLKAWEHWKTCEQVHEDLAQVVVPAGFHPGDAATLTHLTAQLSQLREESAARQLEQAAVESEQQQLQQRPELLARLAEIKSLEQELGKTETCLRELPGLEAEHKSSLAKMTALLQGLNAAWTLDELASLRLDADQRARVRNLVQQHAELTAALAEARRDIKQLESLINRKSERLAALEPDVEAQSLADVLSERTDDASRRTSIRQAKQTEQRLAAEMQDLEERLSSLTTGTNVPLATITPPLDAAVAEFQEQLAVADDNVARLTEKFEELEDHRRQLERTLAELDAGGHIPDIEELRASREQRDAAWELIRRKYVESEACDAEIAAWLSEHSAPLPDVFEASIKQADRLADDRQRQSENVAKKDEYLRQQRRMQAQQADAAEKLNAAQTAREATLAKWRALWSSAGLEPQSPRVMLEWLRLLSGYREKHTSLEQEQQQRARDEAACQAFEDKLRAATGDQETHIAQLIQTAQGRVKDAERTDIQQEELHLDLAESKTQLQDYRAQLAELEQQQTKWNASWKDLLTKLSLPLDWHISAIEQLVATMEQVLNEERHANNLAARLAQMRQQVVSFDQTSQGLAEQAAAELAPLPMLERVRQLARQVEAAQAAQARGVTLAADLERHAHQARQRAARLADLDAQRKKLLAAAGVATEDELRALVQRAQQRDKLLEELHAAERAFGVAREHEDVDDFKRELNTIDRHQLQQARDDLAKEVAELGEQIGALLEDSGGMQQALKLLHEEGDVLTLQQTEESHRSELCAAAQRWASIVLAEKLLERAITDFQREHQPAVLEEARRLFTRMTHEKYIDIRTAAGDTFWVVDRLENELRPDQLSRGTREQLYLAFRLAFVQHYCQSSEPLPVVMDDVLVNFDQERAARTFETLFDLSDHVQIIFLTCHAPTVELVLRQRPTCATIELGSLAEASSV